FLTRNPTADQAFSRPFGIYDDPVGKIALLPPGRPIASRRSLPLACQRTHSRHLFCHNPFFLGTRINLEKQRFPCTQFSETKRFERSIAVAQKNGLILES